MKPKKPAKKKVTPGGTGGIIYYCTLKLANNKACKFSCATKTGLNNHKKAKGKHAAVKPKKPAKIQKVRTLKLTVCKDPYDAMTAEVGEFGVKGIEVRARGKEHEWIRVRLVDSDGFPRSYDTVKLYNDGALNERKRWTEFQWLGHNEAGAKGEMYTIANYGGDEFIAKVKGEVWEIHLGQVIRKHTPQDDEDSEETETDDEDKILFSAENAKLRKRLARARQRAGLAESMPSFKKQMLEHMVDATAAATAAAKAANTAVANIPAHAPATLGTDKTEKSFAVELADSISNGIAKCLTAAMGGNTPAPAVMPTKTDTTVRLSGPELAAFMTAMSPLAKI